MSFWWVNHKQTYKQEVEGGYIWSPKIKKNGGTNQTYLNLTKVKADDIVFSYAFGRIAAVGIAKATAIEKAKPTEFGTAGLQWENKGWYVPIEWIMLSTAFVPKDKIKQISPLLPKKHSPIKDDGNGNQGCYLAYISDDLGKLILLFVGNENTHINGIIANGTNNTMHPTTQSLQAEIPIGGLTANERLGKKSKTHIEKKAITEPQVHANIHGQILDALVHYLRKKYPEAKISPECLKNGCDNRIDIVLQTKEGKYIFYEIKTFNTALLCIRMALGQLLEYAFYPNQLLTDKFYIVSHLEPGDIELLYLKHLSAKIGIEIGYITFDYETLYMRQYDVCEH